MGYTVEAGWEQSNYRVPLVSSVIIFVIFELSVLVQRAIIFDMSSINLATVRPCRAEFTGVGLCSSVHSIGSLRMCRFNFLSPGSDFSSRSGR